MDTQATAIEMSMSLYLNVLIPLTLLIAGFFIPYNPYKRTTAASLLTAHAILWFVIQDEYLAKCIEGRVGYFIGFLHAVDGRRLDCIFHPGELNKFVRFPHELWVLEQLCEGQFDGFAMRALGIRSALITLLKTCIWGVPASLPFFVLAVWIRFGTNLVFASLEELQFEQHQVRKIVKTLAVPAPVTTVEDAKVTKMKIELEGLREEVKQLALELEMEKERKIELPERWLKADLQGEGERGSKGKEGEKREDKEDMEEGETKEEGDNKKKKRTRRGGKREKKHRLAAKAKAKAKAAADLETAEDADEEEEDDLEE